MRMAFRVSMETADGWINSFEITLKFKRLLKVLIVRNLKSIRSN